MPSSARSKSRRFRSSSRHPSRLPSRSVLPTVRALTVLAAFGFAVALSHSLAPTALAVEVRTLSVLRVDGPTAGPAAAIEGVVVLRNDTGRTVIFSPRPFRTDGAFFQFDERLEPVEPGASLTLRYRGQISRAGKWAIELPVDLLTVERRAPIGQHVVDLYFQVDAASTGSLQAQRSTYESLYLRQGARTEPGQGRVFDSLPDTGAVSRGNDYGNRQPPMRDWPTTPDRNPSRRIPPGTGSGQGFLEEHDRDEPLVETLQRWYRAFPHGLPPRAPDGLDVEREAFGAVTASGTWSFRGIDSVLHPAWGWRVRAWVRSGGDWSKVAEDWVESDGRWTLSFNQPSGSQVQFQYVAYNRYFTPQSNDGDTYRWVGPVRGALQSQHAEGSWYADTDKGNARGLGELYRDGYTMWSNLYWQGNINPLRGESIKVVYPNLTYKCGGDSVWSCANIGGTIWLIPTHGTNGQTMIHELGHQLNYEYWDNSLPNGTGGTHSMDKCYTAGLALTEGFANYMVGWTKTNRDTNAGMVRNLEDPGAISACVTKDLNEAWAGAALWDLHDKVADGKDTIWFTNRGAVPGLFLNAGMKQRMSDYRETFRNAANVEHRSVVDGIFEQNNVK